MPAKRTDHRGRGVLRLRLTMPRPPSSTHSSGSSRDPRCPSESRPSELQPFTQGQGSQLSAPSESFTAQPTDFLHYYQRAWTPPPTTTPTLPPPTSVPKTSSTRSKRPPRKPAKPAKPAKPTMAEPRARAARHKGQMNFPSELKFFLLAYGDPSPHAPYIAEPLPETIRVLDEIVTDFILELCHGAAQVAHHARRQKIKVDDFRFALRRDPNKLGRVQELLRMERELKEARKAFDQNDDQVAKDAGKKAPAAEVEEVDNNDMASVTGKKSKGKGKRAAGTRRGSDATEESVSKKRKTT
ncbi:Transcription initiation factor TFIID subunit 13 [Penicillium malachiteum]|uniref:Transcription initiation factor TFIID subunit 13 n=1 Tax=Penicillium malachiteum TaxID=1324776 RepID=UPI002546B39F|nr:Transcription initiation factor TFIID subunit 13 [Penicillium malachiteum]KAJ5714314.1 Transcription initiation factor TFIID subunit 13 [Penicillium malachiteum]